MGSCFLLLGIFPTQGSNPGLLHCQWILYHLTHCLPVQGTHVWSLIWKDHTCHGTAKPMCSLTRETTAMRSLGTAARESLSSNEDPAQPKIKVNKFLKLFFKRATKMKRQIIFAVSLHGKAYVRYAKWPLYIIIVCKFYLYIWVKFGQFSQKEETELTNLFLKVFIKFVIIFFLFYILVFWGMWILTSQPGFELTTLNWKAKS